MNSIEKFVNRLVHVGQLKKSDPDSAEIYAAQRGAERRPSAKSQEAIIDLKAMAAAGMITPTNTRSLITEEYRVIKRPLLKNIAEPSANPDEYPNLIMVTSSLPGEGKSFTSINLAMSIAMEMDHTVLLVEGDVAKPAIAGYLGLAAGDRGLVDYLTDESLSLEDVLMRTNVPKLTLLRAGRVHPNATELLASQNMHRLTKELAQRYPDRVVIIDAPPMLVSSEAAVLSSLAGQIVMVVECDKTPQRVVKDALNLIGPDKIVGVVLNKSRSSSNQEYGYGYYGVSGSGRE